MVDYIKESLSLDWVFITKVKLSFSFKVLLVIKKYFYIFYCIFAYKPGASRTEVFGKNFYFPNKFGVLSIERVFADNYFIKENISKAQVVIDVGAHVGEFNIFSKEYLDAKEIYSFEPFKKSFDLLRKNTESETVYNKAVMERKEAILYVSALSTQLNSLTKENIESEVKDEQKVLGVKLDEFFSNEIQANKVFDLFKIDVEGNELEVIKTATKLINQCKYMIVEVSISRKSELDISNFLTYISTNFRNLKVIALNNYSSGDRSIDILFENTSLV